MLSLDEYCRRIFALLDAAAPEPVDPAAGLFDELALDSLQAFELIVVTEQLAGRDVPPPALPAIWTLGDAYGYYCESVAAARRG
ncbi:MAG: acyl carrier protein [Acidimicrobiales bacterium]